MKLTPFILSSLLHRKASSILSILLVTFGTALLLLSLNFTSQIQNRLSAGQNIFDVVVGAKGSPLQLVLSTLYHADIPTGNIPEDVAERISKNKQIKTAIPISLGDNYFGFRIVGTVPAWVTSKKLELAEGQLWDHDFEAVIGSEVAKERGLTIGSQFAGAHGLSGMSHIHDEFKYTVTGILRPSHTIADRLILTSTNSFNIIHGLHDHDHADGHGHGHEHGHDHGHKHNHAHHHDESSSKESEITALLIEARSPRDAVNLVREINRETSLSAASPAFEMARLSALFGMGGQSLTFLSGLIIFLAAVSIFSGLAAQLDQRQKELALLRALGLSPLRVAATVITEALILTLIGLVIGTIIAQTTIYTLTNTFEPLAQTITTFLDPVLCAQVALLLCGAALVSALVPALSVYRMDVARYLNE
jgi:putative ABC transport system permease protein